MRNSLTCQKLKGLAIALLTLSLQNVCASSMNPYAIRPPHISPTANLATFPVMMNGTALNSFQSDGVVYQSFIQPQLEAGSNRIRWAGMLHALFIDSQSRLREDRNQNGTLDHSAIDNIIELIRDTRTGALMAQRYMVEHDKPTASGPLIPLHQLSPLWDARAALARLSNLTQQREYSATADTGRYILTWLDDNNNQQVDSGETKPFIASSFENKAGYFNMEGIHLLDLINYIRGAEVNGFRSRTIDFNNSGTAEVWRLGNSTVEPIVVSSPASGYHSLFDDTTYKAYQNHYHQRRQVIYLSANDGLLHAFNGGFKSQDQKTYTTTGSKGEVAHPLGSELWAYTPMNVLPHLRWLTEPDYAHTYYIGGQLQAFDVNIFPPDDDHPYGWGTIVVAGMGLGGGPTAITVNNQQRNMRSAYVVLDVTNPEKPPTVIAEITAPSLGFTTIKPALIKQRTAGMKENNATAIHNKWYLVFTSGPDINSEANPSTSFSQRLSANNLKLFIYDLTAKAFVKGFNPLVTHLPKTHGGGMTAVDWNKDFSDDAVYFGTVENTQAGLSGGLYRLTIPSTIATSSLSLLLNTKQPITAAPLTLTDGDDHWIYTGTGRMLINEDNKTTLANSFYGIKEPADTQGKRLNNMLNKRHLINTSDFTVYGSGQVKVKKGNTYQPLTINGSLINNFEELKAKMKQQAGWQVDLWSDEQKSSGSVLSQAKQLFSTILFKEHQFTDKDASHFIHGLHYITGTASPEALLSKTNVNGSDDILIQKKRTTAADSLTTPVLHFGEKNRITIVAPSIKGASQTTVIEYTKQTFGRQSWRQIFDMYK